MMHLRLLTLLALLTAAATGAWADDTFSTSPYETDQQFNNRVTVAANTTLTINKGVTVTAKAGLNIQSGATLTVTGGGTLEIHNRDGADGINAFDDEEFPISSSSGDPGSDAIEGGGTLAIDDATVIAIGSNGGKGGKAHGRRQASDGGDGGYGVSGVIVTIISGSITVLGGSGGEDGAGSSYCAAGSAGADSKGFKTFPTIPGATICWSDNGSDWTPYENNTGETKRYMKAYYYPPTYSVKMKDGTKDAANWTISTGSGDNVRTATGSDADGLMGLYKGDAVTLKYNGRRKVKSVTATTDAEAEKSDLLNGKFSVSATKHVQFAKGNLQATYYDADWNDETPGTWTWGFAENQWDRIGDAAANNAINGIGTVPTNGTVDLFSWVGASSTWTGVAQYGISKEIHGHGNVGDEALKSDWGTTMGTGWRTLTSDEWVWILGPKDSPTPGTNCRTSSTVGGTANGRFAKATVNGKAGVILFPDSYTHPDGVTAPANVNTGDATFDGNNYIATAWAKMEAAGAVFLVAGGYRDCSKGCIVYGSSQVCLYWSSSPYSSSADEAYGIRFQNRSISTQFDYFRYAGLCVRLVKDAQ